MTAPTVFLLAGEPSGDLLGARLMTALKKLTHNHIRFIGVGGPRMRAEGIECLFNQEELALVGTFEILRHVPRLMRRMRECEAAIRAHKPDAVVTIDSPGFTLRVMEKLQGCGIPLIHYVAPSVWAWKEWRAKKMAAYLTHVLALLPFEPPYFERVGLPCTFVGHPIVEAAANRGDAARFRAKYNLKPNQPVLVVLPGSRHGEVSRLGPVFGQTVAKLRAKHPDLAVVVPTFPVMEPAVGAMLRCWPRAARNVIVTQTDDDKYDAFAAGSCALAASGTVALELALAGLPAVIAYKINWLTAWLYRRLIDMEKTKYFNLVNIMHNKLLVPEFIQENCRADLMAPALETLLTDQAAHAVQQSGLFAVASWLGSGQTPPSERAATVVLQAARLTGKKQDAAA